MLCMLGFARAPLRHGRVSVSPRRGNPREQRCECAPEAAWQRRTRYGLRRCRFDTKLDHKLRAVSMTLQTAGDFVVAFTSSAVPSASSAGDPEVVALLGTLWAQKMHNRQLSLEAELSSHVRPTPHVPLLSHSAPAPSGVRYSSFLRPFPAHLPTRSPSVAT